MKHQIHTFKNGLKIVLYKEPFARSVFLTTFIQAGSVFNGPDNQGLHHLVEHLLMQGTKKHPSAEVFHAAAEALYGRFGAHVGLESASVDGTFPSQNLEPALKLLKEALFESRFAKHSVEQEKKVIVNELKERESSPYRPFLRFISERRFKKGWQHYYRIGDLAEEVNKIPFKQVKDFYSRHYVTGNTVLGIAGNFPLNTTLDLVKKIFTKGVKRGGTSEFPQKLQYSDYGFYVLNRDLPQTFFNLNFPYPGYLNLTIKERAALNTLRFYLVGSRLSKLFRYLRLRKRFIYRINAPGIQGAFGGFWGIEGSCRKENVQPVSGYVIRTLKDLRREKISLKRLNEIRNFLIDKQKRDYESWQGIATGIVSDLVFGQEIELPEDYIRAYKKLKPEDVRDMAQRLFDFSKLNINLMGSFSKKERNQLKSRAKKEVDKYL